MYKVRPLAEAIIEVYPLRLITLDLLFIATASEIPNYYVKP